MNRYQTIGPITTASIAAGASLQVNIDAALAGFTLPSSFNVVKVEIVPDSSSLFSAAVYKADTFVAAQLLAKWEDHTGNLYYPINRSGGNETEGLEGFPVPYDDEDDTGELHFKLTNGAAVAHTYAYTFTIEEVPVFTATGNVAFRGTVTGTKGIFGTVGPSASQQHTLPAVTSDIFVLAAATQALTNKTISGASNTLSNIGNASLSNSSITVVAGTNLTGGGVVALGGSVTLNASGGGGVTSAIGTVDQVNVSGATGAVTFSLPQSIATTSSPTFAALTLTAPLTVPNGGIGVATLAANGVLYGNAAGVALVTAQGPANSVLTANAGAPSFSATPTLTSLTLETLNISGTEPRHKFTETDAGADAKLWDHDVEAGVFSLRTRTDADGAGETAISITRSGTDITQFRFNASTGFGFSKTGAAPTHFVDIVAGSLASTQRAFKVTGTLSATAANQTGFELAITSAANSFASYATLVSLLAGSTTPTMTIAGDFENYAAGVGTSVVGGSANYGIYSYTVSTTVGTNIGTLGYAAGGNTNVGLIGYSTTLKNAATNIGVLGLGLNTGTTPIQIGGYFGLQNATPTFISAALIADNGTATSPMFVLRDAGVISVQCIDGGSFLMAGATAIGTNGLGVFAIKNATAPTTTVADTLQIYSADISAGNACLAWFQEAAVSAGIGVASTNKVPAIVNGQTLYLLATTVP